MNSLFRDSRGNLIDLVLSPLFSTMVALGIVLLIIMRAISGIGSSTEFEKSYFVTDLGLLIDGLYGVRADVNLNIHYPAPSTFSVDVSPAKVTVFDKTKDDGKTFWFTEDPTYSFSYGFTKQGQNLPFFRAGHTIGLASDPNLFLPTCDLRKSSQPLSADFNKNNLANLGPQPTDISSGPVLVRASLRTGDPVVKLYVNSNPLSADLACRILDSLSHKFSVQGSAIIPTDQFILPTDPRSLPKDGLSVFADITLPSGSTPSAVSSAIISGVNAYG